jgi:lysophospholipase L1-like esterase
MARLTWALTVLLATSAAQAAPVYTALGASDATGKGSTAYPSVPNGGYVYGIAAWLQARQPSWVLRNRGVNGYTAPEIVAATLPLAIADQPALVTVTAGGNDVLQSAGAGEDTSALAARFETAYATILRRLRQETSAHIVTANVPDMTLWPFAAVWDETRRQLARADVLALNAVIARVAATYGVPVLDLYSDPASYDPANFSADGFHANDTGYAILAGRFESLLLGDVNGDGILTVTDATATLVICAGLSTPDSRRVVVADVWPPAGDHAISLPDAVQIVRRASGLVPDAEWRWRRGGPTERPAGDPPRRVCHARPVGAESVQICISNAELHRLHAQRYPTAFRMAASASGAMMA